LILKPASCLIGHLQAVEIRSYYGSAAVITAARNRSRSSPPASSTPHKKTGSNRDFRKTRFDPDYFLLSVDAD
jgi:hypothetical protein